MTLTIIRILAHQANILGLRDELEGAPPKTVWQDNLRVRNHLPQHRQPARLSGGDLRLITRRQVVLGRCRARGLRSIQRNTPEPKNREFRCDAIMFTLAKIEEMSWHSSSTPDRALLLWRLARCSQLPIAAETGLSQIGQRTHDGSFVPSSAPPLSHLGEEGDTQKRASAQKWRRPNIRPGARGLRETRTAGIPKGQPPSRPSEPI